MLLCEKGTALGELGANKFSLLGLQGTSTGELGAKLGRKIGTGVGEALL